MWSSIENLKQNLNKIALDVHDDEDEDLRIYGSANGHRNSSSVSMSPIANGIDNSPYKSEIDQYKAEIRKLQESEAQIKALSVNYAALLKEKEDKISSLHQENGKLKQNLDATREALNMSKTEISRASSNNSNLLKGSGDKSLNQLHRSSSQSKNRHTGNQMANGTAHALQHSSNSQAKEKELADLLEERNRSSAAMQAAYELQIKQLKMDLEKEKKKLGDVQVKLKEEEKLKDSFQEELRMLKTNSTEIVKLRNQLNEKLLEIQRLQTELNRQENEEANDSVMRLESTIQDLQKENTRLQMEKTELRAALEMSKNSSSNRAPENLKVESPESTQKLEEMERDMKEMRRERDKAMQELTRLKQHLLEKESEESEKMDEDSKIIEELREKNEYQKAQILHLEKLLKQAIAGQEEARMFNSNEVQKSKEIIDDLNKKLANCMSIIESKNDELLNLQSALGQYFAEMEAKEQLERQLAIAREESAKVSELLKNAEEATEASKKDKEDIVAKLSYTESKLQEVKQRVNKLEEDNSKLRRALEQSMTRLNRMSVDSDFLVDRRIVIKLLVTYFQRNHSKEVLDLMVRMLGFTEEDKQRIGVAQQGGKGVVRGVLGLPGRLVGGILKGSSADSQVDTTATDNQSFADLWVDFLLKETEERERREAMEEAQGRSSNPEGLSPQIPSERTNAASNSDMPRSNISPMQSYNPLRPQGNSQPYLNSDSEFSTVPLTSTDSTSRFSRYLQKQ